MRSAERGMAFCAASTLQDPSQTGLQRSIQMQHVRQQRWWCNNAGCAGLVQSRIASLLHSTVSLQCRSVTILQQLKQRAHMLPTAPPTTAILFEQSGALPTGTSLLTLYSSTLSFNT